MSLFGPPNIEKLKTKGHIKGLIKALSYKKDATIRQDAAKALGEIGDPRAVEPLINVLRGDNTSVYQEAVRALGKIGDPRAVEPLITVALYYSGSHFHWDNTDVKREATEALMQIGEPAVEPLIAALGDSKYLVRRKAIEVLGKIGDSRAVEPLIAALGDSDLGVRSKAMEVLVLIGDPAVEPLINALTDSDFRVRQGAAEALGKIGDPRAVEPLITAIADGYESAHYIALGKIGDPRAVEPLIAALAGGDKSAREITRRALWLIGDPAVEPLINALTDSDFRVRQGAAEVLGRMRWEPSKDIERAAYWIATGEVNRLSELDCQAIKQFLIESLEWQMDPDDFYIRGRIAGLLLRPEFGVDDPILVRANDELEFCAKKYSEALDRVVNNPEPYYAQVLHSPRDKAMFEDYADLIKSAVSYHESSDRGAYGGTTYSHDTQESLSAVKRLCQIKTPTSTNLLHHLRKLKDARVTRAIVEVEYDLEHPSGMGERTGIVSFEQQRDAAARELAQRGNPPYDHSVYKVEHCWHIP